MVFVKNAAKVQKSFDIRKYFFVKILFAIYTYYCPSFSNISWSIIWREATNAHPCGLWTDYAHPPNSDYKPSR